MIPTPYLVRCNSCKRIRVKEQNKVSWKTEFDIHHNDYDSRQGLNHLILSVDQVTVEDHKTILCDKCKEDKKNDTIRQMFSKS